MQSPVAKSNAQNDKQIIRPAMDIHEQRQATQLQHTWHQTHHLVRSSVVGR